MLLNFIILILGILGVLAIAFNFILEIQNKLDRKHHIFAILNLFGAASLFSYAFYNKVWLFVILNGFLTVVGVYGIFKVYQEKGRNK